MKNLIEINTFLAAVDVAARLVLLRILVVVLVSLGAASDTVFDGRWTVAAAVDVPRVDQTVVRVASPSWQRNQHNQKVARTTRVA